MRNKGQNLIEFIIIIAVVVLGGILVLTLLGGNINEMFTKSSQKVDTYKPFGQGVTPSTSNTSSSPSPSTSSTAASTLNVNGVNININTDGSATFTYKGQNVALSATALKDMSTAIDTTGSDGTEILIAMVQDMIDEHKAEYEPADVPLEILSGKSVRTDDGGDAYAYGTAELNLVTVKVGDSFKIFQNDSGGSDDKIFKSKFLLEYDAGSGDNDIKVTDENGNKLEVPGFEEDGKSEINDFKTYTDPATGKFYIVGGGDELKGSENDISDSGVTIPSGLISQAPEFFNKGKPIDRVWLLEFNPNK